MAMLMVPISDSSRKLILRELESDCELGPIAFKQIVDDVLFHLDSHFMNKLVSILLFNSELLFVSI